MTIHFLKAPEPREYSKEEINEIKYLMRLLKEKLQSDDTINLSSKDLDIAVKYFGTKDDQTKPDCFGLDDCSTACMSTCKFSKECGV